MKATGLQLEPIVLIDTREQRPLEITMFPVERTGLPVGDYGLKHFSDWRNPGITIERKSLNDLCLSLGKNRDRFLREIEKMRQFRFRALVIEGTKDQVELAQYRSQISPAAVFGTLDALAVRTGLHVFWCGNPTGAARQVEGLVRQFVGGIEKDLKRLSSPEKG